MDFCSVYKCVCVFLWVTALTFSICLLNLSSCPSADVLVSTLALLHEGQTLFCWSIGGHTHTQSYTHTCINSVSCHVVPYFSTNNMLSAPTCMSRQLPHHSDASAVLPPGGIRGFNHCRLLFPFTLSPPLNDCSFWHFQWSLSSCCHGLNPWQCILWIAVITALFREVNLCCLMDKIIAALNEATKWDLFIWMHSEVASI